MKKWEDATLVTLEINATAGGPQFDTTIDGPTWWNEKENRHEGPLGKPEDANS